MKVTIKNIGKIKEAEIDLDKQLTVFFGSNNTGKTYVSYCIYGLSGLNNFVDFTRNIINNSFEIDSDALIDTRTFEIDLIKDLLPQREKVYNFFINALNNYLIVILGNNNWHFSDSECYYSFLKDDQSFIKHFEKLISVKNELYGIEKKETFIKIFLPIGGEVLSNDELSQSLIINAKIFLSSWIFQTSPVYYSLSYFIPAERIGISIFGKELGASRLEQVNFPEHREGITNYPKAINDSLVTEIKRNSNKALSKFNSLAIWIENNIVKGSLKIDENGNVFYSDDNIKNLPLLNTASTIKALSALILYLRYDCSYGQTLIIDEPEINLHPENQVKVARVLAKLSNMGVKVIVSTHSDYIIREFNNLIMLGSGKKENEQLLVKYGYNKDEVLDYNTVGAYHFKYGLAPSIVVTEEGFEASSIDEVIIKQNNASTEIRWSLNEN